jgi:hypothetical protein
MTAAARVDADPALTPAQHKQVNQSVHHYKLHRFRLEEAAARNPVVCMCQVMITTPAVPSKRRGANANLLFTGHQALKGCPHSELERTADRRHHISQRRKRVAMAVAERRHAKRRV